MILMFPTTFALQTFSFSRQESRQESLQESLDQTGVTYLFSESKCILLLQSYQEDQFKLRELRSVVKKYNFRLQKISYLTLSKGKDFFVRNSFWIPVSNSNLILYSSPPLCGSNSHSPKEDQALERLEQVIFLLKEAKILPLFGKRVNTFFTSPLLKQSIQKKSTLLNGSHLTTLLPRKQKLTIGEKIPFFFQHVSRRPNPVQNTITSILYLLPKQRMKK